MYILFTFVIDSKWIHIFQHTVQATEINFVIKSFWNLRSTCSSVLASTFNMSTCQLSLCGECQTSFSDCDISAFTFGCFVLFTTKSNFSIPILKILLNIFFSVVTFYFRKTDSTLNYWWSKVQHVFLCLT